MIEDVVPQDYEALCQTWSDDDDAFSAWRELRLALRGRLGWWFLDPRTLPAYEGGPLWCLGDAPDARLCLAPLEGSFGLYVTDTDEEVVLDEIGEVVAWLDAYQSKHEGLSPGLNELMNGQFGAAPSRRDLR